jgi:hypothetical protein
MERRNESTARRRLLIGLGLALGVAIVAGAIVTLRRDEAHASRWSRLKAGDVLSYSASLRSELTSSGAGGRSAFQMDLAGTWRVTVLEAGRDRAQFHATFVSPRLASEGRTRETEAEFQETEAALAEPYFFTYDGRGALVETRVPPRTPQLATTISRSLSAYLQFVVSPDRGDAWTTTEKDTSGSYEARYRRAEADATYERKKLRYVAAPSGGLGSTKVEVVAADTKYVSPPGGLPKVIDVREHLRTTHPTLPSFESRTTVRLELRGQEVDLSKAVAFLRRASVLTPVAVDVQPKMSGYSADTDRQRIKGRSFHDLRDQLTTIMKKRPEEQTDEDRRAQSESFGALAALLRRDPEAVRTALDWILARRDATGTLLDALGAAGTPEAQRALATVVGTGTFPKVERKAALTALGFVDRPTAETIAKIEALQNHPELGRQAKLSLGTCANRLKGEDPDLARRALDVLAEGLKAEKTDAVMDYLAALGNAGMREEIPHVQPFIAHPLAPYREFAVDALRLVPGDDVDEMLLARLKSDTSAAVRATAARSLRDREAGPKVIAALDAAARTEKDVEARFSVLKTVTVFVDRAPKLAETLAWVGEHDPDPQLRAAIGAHVKSLASKKPPN